MNRYIIKCLSLLSFVLLTNSWGYSQLTTSTLTSTQDSYIDSRFATRNYDSYTSMSSGTYVTGRGGSQYYRRSFVEFDLSAIPSNAIIYSASLDVTRTTSVYGGAIWNTKLITSSWSESTITSSVQPTVSAFSGDQISTTPDPISYVDNIDVTSMVQRMVYGQIDNNGWSIQVTNESYSGTSGANFRTSEYTTASQRPKLVVQYYIPLSIASATVTHESSITEDDGGVSFALNGGSSSSYTYTWINGATGATISSSTSSDPVALTGQSYGWYGLHITGSNGEDFYQGFIIGLDCQEVTITYQPDNNFADNAYTFDWDTGSIDYTSTPIPNSTALFAERWTHSGTWTERISWLNFKLWVDDELDITQADMTLTGYNHASLTGTNESQFDIVTEDWNENYLTWDSSPSTSTSTTENVPNKTSATENSVVDVLDFWNVWQADNSTNHGMRFKLQTTTNSYRRQYYHSTSATTASNRPKIEFKVDLTKTNFLTSTWDPDTELGEVIVDISEVCVKTSPYYYFASRDTIPNIDSLYSFLSDTIIGIDIDSLTFYGMGRTDLNKTYDNLEPGHYHFSAFDVNGMRLFDQALNIQGPITFETQTGLTAIGEEIQATQANGIGALEYYTHEESNTEFNVELTSTSGIQFFGFMNIGSTISNYQDIEYGFYLNGTSLYIVDKGILSTTFTTVGSNVKLVMVNNEGTLKLLIDGIQQVTRIVGTDFEYKFGLQLQPVGKIKWWHWGGIPYKKKYRFFSLKDAYLSCDGGGEIGFSIKKRGSNEICSVTYSITGPGGFSILNQPLSTLMSSPIYTDNNGAPLSAGTYTVSGQINCSGQIIPFSEVIEVVYQVSWAQNANYELIPNDYSLDRDGLNLTQFATARSNNMMTYNVDGWVEFLPQHATTGSVNLFRFTTVDLNGPVTSNIYNDAFIATLNFGGSYFLVSFDPSAPAGQQIDQYLISATSKVKLEFIGVGGSGGTVKINIDGQLEGTITRPYSSILARCQSINEDDGFKNVITSFGCRPSDNQFAELKYEMDGYYHIMKKGKIKFMFNQEYDAADLTFNIYNPTDDLVKSNVDFAAVSSTHGDNYLTIDVSDATHCIGKGFFYLEVINSKKEKTYLRFFNDFSTVSCQDYQ